MAAISNIVAKINKCLGVTDTKNSVRSTENGNEVAESGDDAGKDCGAIREGFSIEDPPNGGVRAWLIVVSCSAISFLLGVLEPAVGLALLSSDEDTDLDTDALTEVYHIYLSLSSVYAPVAAVSMVALGYELTIHIGSWCMTVSFLILSFIKNTHGIKFLLYVTAGVGSSLIQLGILIPVLEYFTTKRMRALMFTKISRYCGQIIPVVIYVSGARPSWQTLYRICIGLSIPIGLIGLTVSSPKPKLKENGKATFIERTVGLVQIKVLKNVYLWLVCFLFFLYQIAADPPNNELTDSDMSERIDAETSAESILYSFTSVLGLIAGAFFGWLFKFSASRNFHGCMKQTPSTKDLFNLILVIIVAISFLMAVMCFIAPEATNLPYFFIFSILFSTQLAFIEELRDDMIPDVFGRQHVKFVEGLIQMFLGIGGIIASETAAELHWRDSFRMGGGMFFATTAAAVCILFLQTDVGANMIKISPLITPDTEDSHDVVSSSPSLSGPGTPVYVTSSSGRSTEATPNPELNTEQTHSLRYHSKTSYGPSNIKFVIPSRRGMYGSRENSISSCDDSVESDSSSSADQQNDRIGVTGHTVYTDLQDSRSPDSYRITQNSGHLPYSFSDRQAGINKPQYIIYSYNIKENTEEV